ncbi:ABC transporter ATP-binding protein/permease [Gillisia sp. M10.2A]|uniref:ABC transporter ATP-binding protein/permease n=1 Tax=Gillisia lutea TaxID=2909668 RepID=A0ABS9EIJ5_9FLAO|nr:ABC transporter ATP-binding protein [Gillisia lutea]MCF4102670.1 ABC transporter ATP-binding protein/permease [Gillisia lutea]
MNYKDFLKKYFHFFTYFHNYLGYRIFIALISSVLVGILDGVGLALFIPLIRMITGSPMGASLSGKENFISELVLDTFNITPNLLNVFMLIFIFFCFKGIAKFFESYLRVVFQQVFMRKVRLANIDLLNSYDFQKFLKSDAGRIQNTLSGEINRLNSAYIHYFKSFQLGVLVLTYIIFALGVDWKFTLLTVFGGVAVNFIFKYLYKRTVYFSRMFTLKTHFFQNLLVQKVYLFKYLKATGLNAVYGEKLKSSIHDMEGIQKKVGLVDALLGALREPLSIVIVFLAVFLNIQFFDESLANVMLSLLLLYRAITFFMTMQEQWNSFLGVSGSLENMRDFTKELERGKEKNGKIIFDTFKEKLVFKDVTFSFTSKKNILSHISFTVHKNETLAIVGESGAGKSTMLNVLSGLLLPTSGMYYVDNIPIHEFEAQSFKKRIGYIVQDATIFNDTIYNNISFWAPKTPENYKRFLYAIKKSAIDDFILNLPNKEDTLLGSNGINISGGQKQRLSIARELFKEVDFLLLDEATSALDTETEAIIRNNIYKLKGEYTIIIIAHRLATIKNADRIILMDKGVISAIGSFEELLQCSSKFRKMVSIQNL